MRSLIYLSACIGVWSTTIVCKGQAIAYKNATLPATARAKDLLSRMTLEEKLAQTQCLWNQKSKIVKQDHITIDAEKAKVLLQYGIGQIARPNEVNVVGGLLPGETVTLCNNIQRYLIEKTRLGIPAMFHEESLHGNQARGATNFPSPLALASTWDTAFVHTVFSYIAREVRARGAHQVLAPVVDIARDYRWGRTEETYGEDPYLTSRLGVAAVRAYQGNGGSDLLDGKHVVSTLKHFPVHGTPEGGVNIGPSFVDERTVREVNFPSFKACVMEAGALGVMPCYNELSGVPAHVNRKYIQGVLRKEWGFKGIVVSDYGAVGELVSFHHVANNLSQAGARALEAGVDIELPDPQAYKEMEAGLKSGAIPSALLDSAVLRILTMKFKLGIFEKPYVDAAAAERIVGSTEGRALARAAAAKGMVLLKNAGDILPLDPTRYKKIAIIGPNADKCILGGYSGVPKQTVTPWQALQAEQSLAGKIVYAEGTRITDKGDWFKDSVVFSSVASNKARIHEALAVAKSADLILFIGGSNAASYREAWAYGHLGDQPTLELPALQNELIDSLTALGKPVCGFFFSGPPLALTHASHKLAAMAQCWYLGQETGAGFADVVLGRQSPEGRLPLSMARSVGHLPVYYSYKPSARRGYLGDTIKPLYAFGYGLTYGKVIYGRPTLSDSVIVPKGKSTLSVTIKNTGIRACTETVQLYVRDQVSSITRPVRELKGFAKVALAAGEEKTISFAIEAGALSFLNEKLETVVEPGLFTLFAGPNSDTQNSVTLRVE